MNLDSIFVLAVFVGTIAGLIRFQNRPAFVFGCTMVLLYASGVVSTGDLISSASNQGLLTLILIMVCSLALEKTRLLRSVATKVIQKSYGGTWFRLFSLTAVTSAFLNNTAVVSTMLAPIRSNTYHPAGKLLIPLSYAAILGGTLTLVGTSTNLIVNSLVIDADLPPLSFFDFTAVGAAVVVTCGATLWLLSRFLPEQEQKSDSFKEYLIDAKVEPGSQLIGKSIEQNGLRHLESLFLVEVIRSSALITPVAPTEVLQEGDRLVFTGDITKVMQLSQFDGLSIFAGQNGLPIDNLTEVVIRPDSMLLGNTLKTSGFRALFDAGVVAIRRDGRKVSGKLGEVVLEAGDYLVLAVGNDFKSRHNITKNFILLTDLEPDSMLSGIKEILVVGGFFAALFCAATGVISLFKGMFLLLGTLVLSQSLSGREIIRRFPSDIWLIISSALLLSQALTNSGVLELLHDVQDNYLTNLTPLVALVSVYILTWILTELVTNNAAAALVFPISYNLALSLDANPMAFIMAVAFGASASFMSPYGYQTNLMVYNAGRYKITDFIKIGLPVSLVYGVVAVWGIVGVFGL
ncbi:SLC13 family permease [Vibrio sp. JC009]|uniref:SLC13 family permease n=1 Tax=Vibrio sp. JC009 TaxID=2912314 RepID=UPI0023B1800E|nr:SLC13 family permease [Vibrio sp. JC009]WED24167.1 SLC13 family permease [Vibrio sp. JC009]